MGLLPKPGNRLTLLCLVVSKDEKGFYGRKDKKKLDGRTEAHPLPPPPQHTHTQKKEKKLLIPPNKPFHCKVVFLKNSH